MNNTLYLFVMLPIVTGLILYILDRFLSRTIAIFMQAVLFLLSLWLVNATHAAPVYQALIATPLPVGMALQADTLSAIMLVLSNFLFGTLVVFSFKKDYMNRLFLFLFLSLQGLINGLFLSTDLFNIYILVEVSTITVSILIMFKRDSQSMYDGMIYLISNMVAMAFFLFGVAFLYKMYGALDLITLQQAISQVSSPRQLIMPFSFLFTGIALKSAVLPLFSWLPKAHGTASAPSVVSAILSGIFVKVGLYLLIRLQLLFNPAIDIQSLLMVLGFLTAIFGFIFAVSQNDIKLILAYHTVSQAGLIILGISGATEQNMQGGLYHILSHGVFKSLLFLISGIMVQHYKTRKIKSMSGLWYASKPLSIVLLMAIFSITGAPFFSGGYSKYFIGYGYESPLYQFLFTLINLGTMASFAKFILVIFSKPSAQAATLVIPRNELGILYTFASVCVLLGTGGNFFNHYFFNTGYSFTALEQFYKIPQYLLMYSICFAIYHYVLHDNLLLKKIKNIEFSFNAINISIVSFFFFTLTYLSNR